MQSFVNHRVIWFHWKSDNNLAKDLILDRPLKYGFLYRHKLFKQYWYLDGDEEYMHRVRKHHFDLLMEWNEKQLDLTYDQIDLLAKIGATEADRYGNRRGRIKIPVCVVLKSGKTIDPCLIQISKEPPFTKEEKTILLGDIVEDIKPTEYALSQDVRVASYSANELRMGFAPTLVETKKRDPFILNWSNDVFQYGDIKGKDIILPSKKYTFEIVAPILGYNDMKVSLVHFDWYDGCESLLIKKG